MDKMFLFTCKTNDHVFIKHYNTDWQLEQSSTINVHNGQASVEIFVNGFVKLGNVLIPCLHKLEFVSF